MGSNLDMVRRLFLEIDAAKVSWGKSSDVTRKMGLVAELLHGIERIADRQRRQIMPQAQRDDFEEVNDMAKAALCLLSESPQPEKKERIETGWTSTCYIASIDGVEVAFIHLCDNGADFEEWQSKWEAKGATVRVGTKHFT